MSVKFNPKYMLKKLYENDEKLGGDRLKKEKEEEAQDEFFVEKDEILKMMREVKTKQDERNEIRRTVGRSHKMMGLNREIVSGIKTAENRIDELNKLLRKQAKKASSNEIKSKESVWKGLKDMLQNLKKIEENSMKIKPPSEIAKNAEIEITTIDMSKLDRAEQRNLSKAEKAFLKQAEKENKEIDDILGDIDQGMDQLLNGIDEISDNLTVQKKRIKKLDRKVDSLEKDISNSNKALKQNLKRFRSATNVVMDIGMILILFVLIGVLIKVLKS